MSKTTVRKTLREFDADQLRELIFDLYSKSKEVKEILDFYADPQVGAKLEQYSKPILKEVHRVYRGQPKPRFTRIRTYLKKLAILDIGAEAMARMRVTILLDVIRVAGDGTTLSEATATAIVKYADETLVMLAGWRLLDEWLPQIQKAVKSMPLRRFHRNIVQAELLKSIERVIGEGCA